jgi:hypothetical protein
MSNRRRKKCIFDFPGKLTVHSFSIEYGGKMHVSFSGHLSLRSDALAGTLVDAVRE